MRAIASVPSGASTGSKEAYELRDQDARFAGKGVLKAVANIRGEIAQSIVGKDCNNQAALDKRLIKLDGTENKSRLGANAILAVSTAIAKAAAMANKIPLYQYLSDFNHTLKTSSKELLHTTEPASVITQYINLQEQNMLLDKKYMPIPMINIINGGAHANNNIDVQECMILPLTASSIKEAIRMGAEVFHALKSLLQQKGYNTSVGDEGGFAPNLKSVDQALELIVKAIGATGLVAGKDIFIALDVAASELYHQPYYFFKSSATKFSPETLINYYKTLLNRFPIISLEDPCAEDDEYGWKLITQELKDKVQLVGDDLFVTNPAILKEGIDKKIANAILIKPNQIGTITQTMQTLALAKKHNYNTIVSHRSGETEDVFIAHLGVATNALQIKTGSMCRSDRTAKYNELIRIEEALGTNAIYAGAKAFAKYL
jgi:enolase